MGGDRGGGLVGVVYVMEASGRGGEGAGMMGVVYACDRK